MIVRKQETRSKWRMRKQNACGQLTVPGALLNHNKNLSKKSPQYLIITLHLRYYFENEE